LRYFTCVAGAAGAARRSMEFIRSEYGPLN
jgi:hypothetical protein